MNILVSGATGFVGRAIVEELILNKSEKLKIYGLGNRQVTKTSSFPDFFKVDLTNSESLFVLENFADLDVIVHSAGLAHQFRNSLKGEFYNVNVKGTKNILEFAVEKSVKHFVLISSVSVYGRENESRAVGDLKKINENEACFPKGEYAVSKLKAEGLAMEICRENNIALTILRLATVVGEGDQGNVGRLIRAIDQKKFVMIGKGENYKTLIYKKDVARACRIVIEKKDLSGREAEIFNVAADPVRMKSVVAIISHRLGKKQTGFFVPLTITRLPIKVVSKLFPLQIVKSLAETLNKWTSNEIYANEKIKQKYSFQPETDITEALGREADFYIKKQKC